MAILGLDIGGANLKAAHTDGTARSVAFPLWKHPECFITPHTAGGSVDEFERLARHFIDNLRRYEAGLSMVNQVI